MKCDYDVGFKKPPTKTRFKKGQSGNPKGRPPKDPKEVFLTGNTMRELLIYASMRNVTVREHGKEVVMPVLYAIFNQLAAKALKGETRAIKHFLDILNVAVNEHDHWRLQFAQLIFDAEDADKAAVQKRMDEARAEGLLNFNNKKLNRTGMPPD